PIVSIFFLFSSRRRHTSFSRDWSSDVCSSDLIPAQVGCDAGENVTCPKGKFIYQTYALNTEVKGPGTYDPDPSVEGDEIDGILVDLYPTQLATSSISVFTKIKLAGLIPLQEETVTNTQVLRMRYAKDPNCEGSD